MPSSTLPFDVIELIFDHLASILEEPERREVGTRLAVVCRDWKPVALRLAWRKISIVILRDNRLLNHLIEFSQALEYTHCLHLLGTASMLHHTDQDKLPEALQNMPEDAVFPFVTTKNHGDALSCLIFRCQRLRHLILPSSEFNDFLHPARLAPFAKTLEHLEINLMRAEDFDAAGLADNLAAFPALHLLKLDARYRGDPLEVVDLSGLEPRTPIQILYLSIIANDEPTFSVMLNRALITSLDPRNLSRIRLSDSSGDTTLRQWLPRCSSLRVLEIFEVDPPVTASMFTALCDVLPHLHELYELTISASEYADPPDLSAFEPSPVELDTFLAALPSSARYFKVGAVHFALDRPRQSVHVDELPEEGCPMLLAVGVDIEDQHEADDEDEDAEEGGEEAVRPRNIAFAKVGDRGGRESWKLITSEAPPSASSTGSGVEADSSSSGEEGEVEADLEDESAGEGMSEGEGGGR